MSTESRPLAIDSRDVSLEFTPGVGVFNLTYQVPEGTILGMIGPSGCGKTTTVRLMTGLYRPQRGEMTVLNYRPSDFRADHRERIGYIPQQFVLYPNLTVVENLHFVAALYGMTYRSRVQRMNELLAFVGLGDAHQRMGSQLSGGMQRRLMLAGALMHNPALLFADEPTAGIDPVLRGRFWDYFRKLRNEGRTLFVTTQYVGEAAYCDYVAVMRAGRLITVDTPEGLRRQALGGEIITVTMRDPTQVAAAMAAVRDHAAALGVLEKPNAIERSNETPGKFQIFVDNASDRLPELLHALHTHSLDPDEAEEYQIPYDDIFIKLMNEKDREERAGLQPAQPTRTTTATPRVPPKPVNAPNPKAANPKRKKKPRRKG